MTNTNQDLVQCDAQPDVRPVAPRYRLRQEDHANILEVELPGVAPDGIELALEQRVLSLSATPAPLHEGGEALHVEFEPAPFQQRWRLQTEVDVDAIQTSHANGVLTVTLPEKAPERRSIPIVEA